MPGPFDAAGATHVQSDYAPLTMDRYITGLVTNRNPLRDAAVPYMYAKYYQAGRFDSIWDGCNVEVSSRLTLVKRPGLSVWNGNTFPAIQRFAEFHTQVDGRTVIRTVADTLLALYDVTAGGKKLLWNKSAGSGRTSFQSVGNTLYMANGKDSIKWTVSVKSYQPQTQYSAGDFINDTNGNIQVAFGFTQAQIVASAISAGPHPGGAPPVYNRLDLQFDRAIPFALGETVNFSGLAVGSIANGHTGSYLSDQGSNTARFLLPIAAPTSYALTPDAGTAYAGGVGSAATGTTGSVAPVWATTTGAPTTDSGVVWVCKGSAVQAWGTAAPTVAPTLNQSPAPNPFGVWAASTYFSPNQLTYNAGAPTVYAHLVTDGTTGGSEPSFSATPGVDTTDGTAIWQTVDASWNANTSQFLGDIKVGYVVGQPRAFRCIVAGITGSTFSPVWLDPLGTQITDGTVVWENAGPVVEWATGFGPSLPVSTSTSILDPGGFQQAIEAAGRSGTTAPTWNEILSAYTFDGSASWSNRGPYAPAGTAGATGYAIAYKSSVTQLESTVSPIVYVTLRALNYALLQGYGSPDPQIDTIVIYRTVQGGSTLLYDSEIPAPASGQIWSYLDTVNDAGLNIEIQGARTSTNAPPPAGLTGLTYHMSRIWGAVGSLLYYCTGPDASVGNGLEAWSPSNVFALPDGIARNVPWDLPNGVLLSFTSSGPYGIWGEGTAANPFYPKVFTQGAGLVSEDELCTSPGWIHQLTTDRRLMSFQPIANYTVPSATSEDAGAPIGDQFVKVTTAGYNAPLFQPGSGHVTWHSHGTNDTGLFVSDGAVGWFRFSQITAPEQGYLWSPFAAIVGGTSAVQSVETAPGINTLLVGPPPGGGPIMARDPSVNTDNGTPFAAYATIGSLQLCQPTETAEVVGVVLDSMRVGTSPGLAILFDEIAATLKEPFITLEATASDPIGVPPSQTLYSDYFAVEQNGHTNQCRHIQLLVSFTAEDAPGELLGHTVYGKHTPMRRQD